MKKRPQFRKPRAAHSYATPEELFAKLPNRTHTHGYLRGPQTDALRDYETIADKSDIAFELPTGTGKTSVGLLIAEWRRRKYAEKVAFLTLTNQLAKQVLKEAANLGLDCADLTGDKDTRDAGEVGRYIAGRAIGVTTYSNLFNVNPVVQASNVLIFDDAHGGEQYVASMWTVRIDSRNQPGVYQDALEALRPTLTEAQYRVVNDEAEFAAVELADIKGNAGALANLTEVLDPVSDRSIRYAWGAIRNYLQACLFLVSHRDITIRPLVPPTHTHQPFNDSAQRIYMSATLGGEGDLLRGYGIKDVGTIRAKHAQWGRRYIFMPNLYLEEEEAPLVVSKVWSEMSSRRALVLAPSFSVAERAFESIAADMMPQPRRLDARDIEHSLDPFTQVEDVVLCLAGRYDGIDLPGDDCRLLVVAETPGAIGALERHLREHWKLGPLLRRRERTRFIQGMGRCTRDATDFAVIILLGQSLVDNVSPRAFAEKLPGEIQRELLWGMEQGEVAREDAADLVEMIVGLLTDDDYRKAANESLVETDLPEQQVEELGDKESGKSEVEYLRASWGGDHSGAYRIAREAADVTNGPALAGYRAWWLYLASLSARENDDLSGEIDCLKRAKSIGINTGFLDRLVRARTHEAAQVSSIDVDDVQAEAIWNKIEEWGWQGPGFRRKLEELGEGLTDPSNATRFHIGLELLGQCLGADTIRSTEDGVPDVAWIFFDRCFTFEAKAAARHSKKNVQQAKGHPEWLRAERPETDGRSFQPLLVASGSELYPQAEPHAEGLNFVSVAEVTEYAESVVSGISELRTYFVGKEYAAVKDELKEKIRQAQMDRKSVDDLLSKPLA